MRRALPGLALAALLAVAGCSGGSSDAPAPTDPASPASSGAAPSGAAPASPAPSGSASPSLATLPVAQCLTGEWTLVRFVALGGTNTYGTGQGGDVTVRFEDGSYTLQGGGAKPILVSLAGQNADLTVDGTVSGRYTVDGSAADFTTRRATGSATLAAGGQQQRLDMDQVAQVVGLTGTGQVACTATAMTITLTTVRLELGRV